MDKEQFNRLLDTITEIKEGLTLTTKKWTAL